MRSIQTAVEFLGAAIYRLRSHFEYGLKTISIIAAITIMIAAAVCILPALAVKSEAALTVQDAGPTPATLYYPFHLAAPRIDNIKPQETETLRGAAAEEEDTETAVPPDQEDIKTPALPEAEQVYADAPKKEMSAKEMFKEEFPHENFGKTKRILARVIHGEGKGTKSITNRAAIVETVLNRVDARMRGDTPYECATAHSQFCVSRKCTKEELWIAEDVLKRWLKIRRGEDAEWILPKGYLWFHGTYPRHDWNVFRNKYHFRDKPRYKTPLHSKIYGD